VAVGPFLRLEQRDQGARGRQPLSGSGTVACVIMLRLAAICLLVVSLLGRTDAFVICPIARAHGRSVQAGAAISTRVRCTAASVLEKDIAEKVLQGFECWWP
jgi:hypothetical protein